MVIDIVSKGFHELGGKYRPGNCVYQVDICIGVPSSLLSSKPARQSYTRDIFRR